MQDENLDLFFEVECHTLIGVANVFLECLLHDVNHEYAAPIISQQGEVSVKSLNTPHCRFDKCDYSCIGIQKHPYVSILTFQDFAHGRNTWYPFI